MTKASKIFLNVPLSRENTLAFFESFFNTHFAYLTPEATGLNLGYTSAHYDDCAASIEGISRLLLGVAAALRGRQPPASMPILWRVLFNGTDPQHPGFWGEPSDFDQRLVEMAAISDLILSCSQKDWEALPEEGRDHLCHWLSHIITLKVHPNNWVFFRVMTQLALRYVGHTIDEKILADDFQFIDDQYIANGWYQDNQDSCFDYYNAFTFHYYGLRYAQIFEKTDPLRSNCFVSRARIFAKTYLFWFAHNGAPIAYGRSLTYRAAALGFWGLLAYFGHPDISMGELRGLWERGMRYWLDLPITDERGVLSIGYAYPNLIVSEYYSSPQSPLWMCKAFTPITLFEEHPFWKLPPSEHPIQEDEAIVLTDIKQMLQRQSGQTFLIAASPRKKPELRGTKDKYFKFAYSSSHGFSVEGTQWIHAGFIGDNLLAFSNDQRHWVCREAIDLSFFEEDTLVTVWSPMKNCTVTTRQKFTPLGENRFHFIENKTNYPLFVIASGHAVDAQQRAKIFQITPNKKCQQAFAIGKTLHSRLTLLSEISSFSPDTMPCAPNTHLLFPHAIVPISKGILPEGKHNLNFQLSYGASKNS